LDTFADRGFVPVDAKKGKVTEEPKSLSPVTETSMKKKIAAPVARAKAEHGTSLLTAFREIRELIVHGKLSPGAWILEAELADRLNMSRTPVRGAIHWLQREGYILEHRNAKKSRMIVAPLTKEDANELYLIIGRLEGIAGRGIAALPLAEREDICSQLRELNDRLLVIAKDHDGNPGEIFENDRSFHRLMIKYGAGPRMTTLHSAIEPQTERYWRLYASSIIKDLHLSVGEHNEVIEAIQAGDPDRVEAGLQRNWLKGAERLGHVIDIFGERGSW
jgi:DNA-binding GntR family transcriptional regulator